MKTKFVLEQKSGKWDKGTFAGQAIRIWACQPNYPRHSTDLFDSATCLPLPIGTQHTTEIENLLNSR